MTTTHELLKRIENLEVATAAAERRARRARKLAAGLGLLLTAVVAVAARPTIDVITASRLEIVGDDGELLVTLGGGRGGGQLDIWSAEGRNVLRATANTAGGDLTMWNGNGSAVFAAYASEAGGEAAVWTAEGGRAGRLYADGGAGHLSIHNGADEAMVTLGADADGGDFEVLDASSTVVVTGQASPSGGSLSIRNTNGHPVVVHAADEGGQGVSALAAADGSTRLWHGVTARGGVSRLYNDQLSVVATLGTTDGSADGYVTVANAQGQAVVTAQTEDNGGGRLDVLNAEGGRVISGITTAGGGGGMALLSRNGTQMIVFDSNLVGGRLWMMNGLGLPSVFAGAAEDGRGGVVSMWNGRNSQVTELGAGENEDGRIRLWDAAGGGRREIGPG